MPSTYFVAELTLCYLNNLNKVGCVILMKEVKNITSIWSPCGCRAMKGGGRCFFEVTHGFSQHRQINISLALTSL